MKPDLKKDKTYIAEIELGKKSNTYDSDGLVRNIDDCYIEPDEYYMTFYRMFILCGNKENVNYAGELERSYSIFP